MEILIIFILVYLIFYLWNKIETFSENGNLINVKSDIDGKSYLVQNSKDAKDAANMLANIRIKLLKLKKHLIKKYPNDPRIKQLKKRFDGNDPNVIIENNLESKFTSYTQNKGEKIVFCLRTKNDNKNEVHSTNLLMFVAIHELAHIITESIGHDDPTFWKNFEFLLREAMSIGVWEYIDFRKTPQEYCGMKITNPVVN
jgi:predicted metal-dependent hydrolase